MVIQKKTQGRQKIEMKELRGSKQQVTFSKRRAGLFKKAGELCVLCGAEVAVIVFSRKDKVFCFGHPDVETVLDRYLTTGENTLITDESSSSQNYVAVNEFNMQYAEAQKELEMEKNRLEEMKKKTTTGAGGFWWDEALDENMGLEEMQQYMWALEEARKKVAATLDERMRRSSLMSAMNMREGVGNYVGLANDFVNPNLKDGNGGGVFNSHGYGFGHGRF